MSLQSAFEQVIARTPEHEQNAVFRLQLAQKDQTGGNTSKSNGRSVTRKQNIGD